MPYNIFLVVSLALQCYSAMIMCGNCTGSKVALKVGGVAQVQYGPPCCSKCVGRSSCTYIANTTVLIGPVQDDYSIIASLMSLMSKNPDLAINQVAIVGLYNGFDVEKWSQLLRRFIQSGENSKPISLLNDEKDFMQPDSCLCFEKAVHIPVVPTVPNKSSQILLRRILQSLRVPYHSFRAHITNCRQYTVVSLYKLTRHPVFSAKVRALLHNSTVARVSEDVNAQMREGIVISGVVPSLQELISLHSSIFLILISANGYPHGLAYICKQLGLPFRHFDPTSNVEKLIEGVMETVFEAIGACYDPILQSVPGLRTADFRTHSKQCSAWTNGSEISMAASTSVGTAKYFAASCGPGSEQLYNGICLQDPWPPRYSLNHFMKLSDQSPWIKWRSSEAVRPPYESNSRRVTPVDLGRQLFVDNFLIDELCSMRWTRQYHHFKPIGTTNMTAQGLHTSAGASVVADPITQKLHLYYPRKRGKGAGGAYSWPFELVRFTTSLTKSKDWIHSWGEPQLTIHDEDPLSGTSTLFSVVLMKSSEKCRFVMFVTPTIAYNLRFMSVRCSTDGLRFHTAATNVGRVLDGAAITWNPFRRLFTAGLRDNLIAFARVRRYAEFKDPVSGQLWSDFALCERNFTLPGKDKNWDLTGLWSRCFHAIEGAPVYQLCPVAEDPEYRNSWDNIYHNNQSAFFRVSDLYDFKPTVYESLFVAVRVVHIAGRSLPKLTVPSVSFSRDGFHYTTSEFNGSFEVDPGYLTGHILPSSTTDTVILARLFDGNCLKDEDTCSLNWFELRRDGYASIKPLPDERADLWTTWLSMTKLSYLYVNADLGGDGEIFPCIYPANEIDPFCYEPVAGPKNSTSGIAFPLPTGLAPISSVVFKIRFRLFGNTSLYSFWFQDTKSHYTLN